MVAIPHSPVPASTPRIFMHGVYSYMALGLAVTGAVAYLDQRLGFYTLLEKTPDVLAVVLVAPLALVLLLSYRIEKMSVSMAHFAFWFYAALVGLSLSGIFELYAGASVARTFFITAAMFAAMGAYGFTTHKDLSRFGSILLMGLVGLVVYGLLNAFFFSTYLQATIETVGVVVFVALTAYDTQHIKELYRDSDTALIAGKKEIIGTLALYLDFVNLFLTLLQLRRWGFALARHSHRMAAWSRLLASGERRSRRTWRQSARRTVRWLRAAFRHPKAGRPLVFPVNSRAAKTNAIVNAPRKAPAGAL